MHSYVQQYTRSHRLASHCSHRLTRITTQTLATPKHAKCRSPRIARIASLALASHRLASQHRLALLASPRSHRLASPRSPCLDRHRLGFDRFPRLALLASPPCSPRLARLASPESLALPRLARLASLASPLARSPRLRARLPRSPCLLPRLGHRAACHRRPRCLARHLRSSRARLQNLASRHTQPIRPPNSIFGWHSFSDCSRGSIFSNHSFFVRTYCIQRK